MADYNIAYRKTAAIEMGYANDPDDTGGETAFGLTRRDWPTWSGWTVIDSLKKLHGLTKAITLINSNQQLKDSSKALFKANYWNVINLSLVNDQQIANQAFDTAINNGVGIAAKILQTVAKVTVDLHVGPKTIAAVNAMEPHSFYNQFIALRKKRFDDIIAFNPSQIKFKKSWYSRLTPYQA